MWLTILIHISKMGTMGIGPKPRSQDVIVFNNNVLVLEWWSLFEGIQHEGRKSWMIDKNSSIGIPIHVLVELNLVKEHKSPKCQVTYCEMFCECGNVILLDLFHCFVISV